MGVQVLRWKRLISLLENRKNEVKLSLGDVCDRRSRRFAIAILGLSGLGVFKCALFGLFQYSGPKGLSTPLRGLLGDCIDRATPETHESIDRRSPKKGFTKGGYSLYRVGQLQNRITQESRK